MNTKWVPFGSETVSLNSKRNVIQQMCLDHYEEIQYVLHPRPVVMDNIDRLINCGDPDYGGALYICPKCGSMFLTVAIQSYAAPVVPYTL